MPSVSELVVSSSLVFTGVVIAIGESAVSALPSHRSLVTVRVSHVLRSDPALGDLRNRVVTVKTATAQQLRPQQSALFFTRSWIHANTIAVQELERMDVSAEAEAAAAVQGLPEAHLRDRVAGAEQIVLAEVTRIQPVANQNMGRRAPHWAAAVLSVESAVKGGKNNVTVLFPTADDIAWYRAPHFVAGQRGVFIIHRNEARAVAWINETAMGVAALTALDPSDFQAESELNHIARLTSAPGGRP